MTPHPALVEAVLSAIAVISWPGTVSARGGAGATLRGDLAMDSLAIVSLATELDEAFAIAIPDDELADWETVADVATTLASLGCAATGAA